jgi:hypothetical protein
MSGCEIFRTQNGYNWEVVVGGNSKTKNGFYTARNFYCWSMEVYDGYLYVGTLNYIGGGEIWKTKDGITWEPVIAYALDLSSKLHGADYPRGFNSGLRNYRGGVRNMVVYNDELYVAFTAEDKRFCIIHPVFGKFIKFGQGFLMCHPIRRFSSYGLDIFKYNSTTDKWIKVVGGLFRGNASSGFGDSRNEYPWSMIVHDDYLYVGTLCIDPLEFFLSRKKLFKWGIGVNMLTGGGELWRFDGINWEQVNEDGFGDNFNVGIRELAVYNDCLIACTMNISDGCEVWKYNLN